MECLAHPGIDYAHCGCQEHYELQQEDDFAEGYYDADPDDDVPVPFEGAGDLVHRFLP